MLPWLWETVMCIYIHLVTCVQGLRCFWCTSCAPHWCFPQTQIQEICCNERFKISRKSGQMLKLDLRLPYLPNSQHNQGRMYIRGADSATWSDELIAGEIIKLIINFCSVSSVGALGVLYLAFFLLIYHVLMHWCPTKKSFSQGFPDFYHRHTHTALCLCFFAASSHDTDTMSTHIERVHSCALKGALDKKCLLNELIQTTYLTI